MSDLGIRPFNARSLVLSVLLGLPQSRLPAAALGRLAELFGIAPGTMRTAISRMVASGELAAMDGCYELHGPLLARKAAQDIGRRPASDDWDGTWWIVTTVVPSRALGHRREFRSAMANGRMGELRPDTWLRPTNLVAPGVLDGTILVRGRVEGIDDDALVRRLWDLPSIERRCRQLLAELDHGLGALDGAPDAALRDGTMLAAAIVHFLRAEPLLPRSLALQSWSADELREHYAEYDRALGQTLRTALGATR